MSILDGNISKILADHFREYEKLVLENERDRIYNKIKLLILQPDLPKESDRVLRMVSALVLNPELKIQDLFDIMYNKGEN